jgi:integrase/recombinase XerD
LKSPVKLYIRVRLPDGSYPYLKPAYASNGRIRPHHAIHEGKATPFPGSSYYLRVSVDGKRTWEPAGDDPSLALVSLQKKTHALQAVALGLAETVPSPPSATPDEPSRVDESKRLLADCVTEYIVETTEHKSTRTLAAYKLTVLAFCGSVTGTPYKGGTRESFLAKVAATQKNIEDIRREDLLAYAAALRGKGNSPRTIRNRIDHLQIFLHHFGLPSLLKGSDLPKYTTKKVRAYNPLELGKMFGRATQDESDLLHFLLCTGAREQEAQFVCWSDVDLEQKTYTVTEHLDLGYRPKDKEEGTVPIPDLLVDVLKARRGRYPKTRLIFPGKSGKPNGHALRTVKRLALRAGANCGQCVNKAGNSCATHPVCRHILLHKMRKTFASTLHHNGLPAQTLQRYLRHSDLSTTLAYIADQPDEQVRETINSTFASFTKVGGAA